MLHIFVFAIPWRKTLLIWPVFFLDEFKYFTSGRNIWNSVDFQTDTLNRIVNESKYLLPGDSRVISSARPMELKYLSFSFS